MTGERVFFAGRTVELELTACWAAMAWGHCRGAGSGRGLSVTHGQLNTSWDSALEIYIMDYSVISFAETRTRESSRRFAANHPSSTPLRRVDSPIWQDLRFHPGPFFII